MTDEDRQDERFDSALREWGRQAPRTPADVAAKRVSARIESGQGRGAGVAWWLPRLATAGVLALVVASGAVLLRHVMPPPLPAAAVEPPPVLPENVVVFWLDPETPVYFVVGPPVDTTGGTP